MLGIPLGALISLKTFPGKGLVVNILNTFMSLPPVVAGLVVYILLSNSTGLVGDHKLLFTPLAMMIAQFFLALPLMAGLTYVAVTSRDEIYKLSAISLGASPRLVGLTMISEARYSIFSAIVVVFGRLLAEVGAVMMVGGNIRYQTRVMTTAIALQKGMGEFEKALALGIILLILSFIINGILETIRRKGGI